MTATVAPTRRTTPRTRRRPRGRSKRFSFTSLFCGAGGDITGMIEAGGELVAAANHWDRAMETIDANYGDTGAELMCVDINHYDMRRLPKAQVLWASVICTEVSPAGGNKKHRGQQILDLEEQGHVPSAAYERTRACAWDVVRATEVHRYDIVVVENVVEFARDWELFDAWLHAMCALKPGYEFQILSADAAHIGDEEDENDPAAQWRGRIFVVFNKVGVPKPDLELRPKSFCPVCDGIVEGVQWWKRNDRRKVGKYGRGGQYLYRCSVAGCGAVVEPLVLPAAAIIDWTDLGERIGDRKRPLAASTMARIAWGAEHFGRPMVATVAGNTYERGSHRVWPADASPFMARVATAEDALAIPPLVVNSAHNDSRVTLAEAGPLPTRTVKIGDGLATSPFLVKNYGSINEAQYRAKSVDEPVGTVVANGRGHHGIVSPEPFVTMLRNNNRASGMDEPVNTVATGNHHYLTVPPDSFVVKNYGGNARPEHLAKSPGEPLGSITTKDQHALVVPYRRGNPKTAASPLHTLGTHDSAALVIIREQLADFLYRMFRPREHLRAQRFHDSYVVKGNAGEVTMQAGNAVPVNAGHFIGRRIAEALA